MRLQRLNRRKTPVEEEEEDVSLFAERMLSPCVTSSPSIWKCVARFSLFFVPMQTYTDAAQIKYEKVKLFLG